MSAEVAIVTGGARGIGREYCLALAGAGFRVAAADVLDAGAVVAEIAARGGEAIAITVDVADPESVERMAARVLDDFGQIDVLVNNAAMFATTTRAPFEEITPAEWDAVFAVNVRGAWLCTRAVVPAMRTRGSGRVINIGSSTVAAGLTDALAYLSSKSALIGMTRALARALGPDGIAVNLLVPDRVPHADIPALPDAAEDAIAAERAFARLMTPGDLLGPLLFLASSSSDFVTGQILMVDGGRHFTSM